MEGSGKKAEEREKCKESVMDARDEAARKEGWKRRDEGGDK